MAKVSQMFLTSRPDETTQDLDDDRLQLDSKTKAYT